MHALSLTLPSLGTQDKLLLIVLIIFKCKTPKVIFNRFQRTEKQRPWTHAKIWRFSDSKYARKNQNERIFRDMRSWNYPSCVFLKSHPTRLAASFRTSLQLPEVSSFFCLSNAFPTAPLCLRTSDGSTS